MNADWGTSEKGMESAMPFSTSPRPLEERRLTPAREEKLMMAEGQGGKSKWR